MKIRFDENISPRVFEAVKIFAPDRAGFETSHNRSAGAGGKPDPQWIKSFAAGGGAAVISGDYRILQNWPDLTAYIESGLVAYFPPTGFKKLKGHGRAAFLIRWWPAIVEHAKTVNPGTAWRLKMSWTPDPNGFERLKLRKPGPLRK